LLWRYALFSFLQVFVILSDCKQKLVLALRVFQAPLVQFSKSQLYLASLSWLLFLLPSTHIYHNFSERKIKFVIG
jgi:hypothetical protein